MYPHLPVYTSIQHSVWAMGLFTPLTMIAVTAVTAVTAATAGIKSSRVKSTLEIQIEHFVALPSVSVACPNLSISFQVDQFHVSSTC